MAKRIIPQDSPYIKNKKYYYRHSIVALSLYKYQRKPFVAIQINSAQKYYKKRKRNETLNDDLLNNLREFYYVLLLDWCLRLWKKYLTVESMKKKVHEWIIFWKIPPEANLSVYV